MIQVESAEVALFIDLENIRYSCLNVYQREPEYSDFIEKARKHGRISLAVAYADFDEHPAWIRRQLGISGIRVIDVPVKRIVRDGVERVKSSADLFMMNDIWEAMVDRENVSTFVIMTGDSDFIQIVTTLRNRFRKTVVICGVPGTVSQDLAQAANSFDHLESVEREINRETVSATVHMMMDVVPPVGFWTYNLIAQWMRDSRNSIPGTDEEKADALAYMYDERMILKEKRTTDRGDVTISFIDREHPEVLEIFEEEDQNSIAGPEFLEDDPTVDRVMSAFEVEALQEESRSKPELDAAEEE